MKIPKLSSPDCAKKKINFVMKLIRHPVGVNLIRTNDVDGTVGGVHY